MYGASDDAVLGRPAQVDLSALLAAALPAGVTVEGAREMTLDGFRPVETLDERRRFPIEEMAGLRRQGVARSMSGTRSTKSDTNESLLVMLRPMELKTFQVDVRA